jgi:hypothetical protein
MISTHLSVIPSEVEGSWLDLSTGTVAGIISRLVHWIFGIHSPKVSFASSFLMRSRSFSSVETLRRSASAKNRRFSASFDSRPGAPGAGLAPGFFEFAFF